MILAYHHRHLLALVVASLVSTQLAFGANADEELEALTERITAYWDARVIDDPITMYDFEFSGVDGSVSLRDYVRVNGQLNYNSATLKQLQRIDNDTALAVMEVEYRVPGMGGDWLSSELVSQWELFDGLWYHVGQPTVQAEVQEDTSAAAQD